jgi:hypothetical protein
MASLADVLNGSKVILLAETTPNVAILIGGQVSHSKNLVTEAIDISNKSLPNAREFLEGEGKQTADIASEIIFSTDVAYQFLLDQYIAKTFFFLQVRYGPLLDRVERFKVMITAISEPAEQNSALISSVTISSTEGFELNLAFQFAVDTGADFAVDTATNKALGRV